MIMKKTVIIAAMLAASVSVSAQFEQGTLSVQPKLGFSSSRISNLGKDNVYGDVFADKKSMDGALLGVEAEYQLTPELGIAAGLNYSLQGSAWEDMVVVYVDDNGVSQSHMKKDNRMELGYITVPVTANYYLFEGFAVKAGLQFGFMTNASHKYDDGTDKHDIDAMSGMKKFDLSIPVGVSYQFKFPIVLDLRFNLGLTKVNDSGSDGMRNRQLLLTVGYKFAL